MPRVNQLFQLLNRAVGSVLVLLVRAYQLTLGPFLGGHCRFHPSCSHYGIEALREHGALRGIWLTLARLAKCHPLHEGGVDLVPPRRMEKLSAK